MTYSEAHKRADAKYKREKTRQVVVRFYHGTDGELLDWLQAQENMQGYIKRLIRDDMNKSGLTSKNI